MTFIKKKKKKDYHLLNWNSAYKSSYIIKALNNLNVLLGLIKTNNAQIKKKFTSVSAYVRILKKSQFENNNFFQTLSTFLSWAISQKMMHLLFIVQYVLSISAENLQF